MKVSVVITTLNEAESINRLIDSLSYQSKKPDEIIVVDAGSKDGTRVVIKKYPQVKLITKPGFNRSRARNLGIKAAKNEIIAVTDAGCTADKYWLERLTKPFKDKAVLSAAGYYRPVTKNSFQKSIAPLVAVLPDKFNPKTYLPSSRSLAFRKGTAWYPENLNYCEDLIFARELKTRGKMAVVKTALVHWQLAENWRQFFWQIFHYAQGDVAARYRPHLIKIASVWLRYVLFIFFPPLFLIYLLVFRPIKLVADLAIMAGSLSGIIFPR